MNFYEVMHAKFYTHPEAIMLHDTTLQLLLEMKLIYSKYEREQYL